jgi:hypothetical protein
MVEVRKSRRVKGERNLFIVERGLVCSEFGCKRNDVMGVVGDGSLRSRRSVVFHELAILLAGQVVVQGFEEGVGRDEIAGIFFPGLEDLFLL